MSLREMLSDYWCAFQQELFPWLESKFRRALPTRGRGFNEAGAMAPRNLMVMREAIAL